MTFDVMNCQLPTSVLTIWLQVIYLPDLKMKCMEFVCIETKTFEDMCIALELLKRKWRLYLKGIYPSGWTNGWTIRKYAPYCAFLHVPCNPCGALVPYLIPR